MSGLLDGLPSFGTCTAARPGLHGSGVVYLATHDTSPPAEQVIRTDGTNLLVRALTLKKEREERARAAEGGKGKRPAGGEAGGAPQPKKPVPPPEPEAGPLTERAVRAFTVPQLKAALQRRGLTVGGKKEDLVERLLRTLPKATPPEGAGAA